MSSHEELDDQFAQAVARDKPFAVPCSVCGASTLRVEFRDQFNRDPLVAFNPKANGMWVVCENGHESQP